jgi:hydrogenase maturation protease
MTATDPGAGRARPGDDEGCATPEPLPAGSRRALQALIIGYGSPIRGDDALGPLVADRLADRLHERAADRDAALHRDGARIEVQARHILTAEIVDDLERAERVIFVDAAADAPAGEVRWGRLAPDTGSVSSMAHFHDPRELLAWCQALYGHAPEAWLVSAGGADWGYACYELSPAAARAVEPMLARVLALATGAGPEAPA